MVRFFIIILILFSCHKDSYPPIMYASSVIVKNKKGQDFDKSRISDLSNQIQFEFQGKDGIMYKPSLNSSNDILTEPHVVDKSPDNNFRIIFQPLKIEGKYFSQMWVKIHWPDDTIDSLTFKVKMKKFQDEAEDFKVYLNDTGRSINDGSVWYKWLQID
jgi:hypothetical protein